MRNVPEIGYRQPQLQVLHLLFICFVLYLNAPSKAYYVELFIVKVLNMFEAHQFILLSQAIKVQLEFPGNDHLCENLNNGRIHGDLDLEDSHKVI